MRKSQRARASANEGAANGLSSEEGNSTNQHISDSNPVKSANKA
jgi:hypothetical protein